MFGGSRGEGRGSCAHTSAIAGMGAEQAVVASKMDARRWDERGQRAEELERGHDAVGGAVGAGALHAIRQITGGQAFEALASQRRAKAVAADTLETGAIASCDLYIGLEREALDAGAAWTMHWKVKAGTRRLDGRSVDPLQGVGFEPEVGWIESPEEEQARSCERSSG